MRLEEFLKEVQYDQFLMSSDDIGSITVELTVTKPNFCHSKVTYHKSGQVEEGEKYRLVRICEQVSQRKIK
jgi:hypothetical protein